MIDVNSPRIAAAIAELANSLQVAIPAAARLCEHIEAEAEEAERLEDALTRAMQAIRQLQPPRDR
jgi:hypothetical protein